MKLNAAFSSAGLYTLFFLSVAPALRSGKKSDLYDAAHRVACAALMVNSINQTELWSALCRVNAFLYRRAGL